MDSETIVPIERIESKIYFLRGHKVMLDSDLSTLYKVETKYLVRAVKRNLNRFPEDFSFQLTNQELETLRCHFGTSKSSHGGRRYAPWVFTEHGIFDALERFTKRTRSSCKCPNYEILCSSQKNDCIA